MEKYNKVIDSYINDLIDNKKLIIENPNYGLLTGKTGILLLLNVYYNTADLGQKERIYNFSQEILSSTFDYLPRVKQDFSYCSGLTGLLFGLRLLDNMEAIQLKKEVITFYESYLKDFVNNCIKDDNWDPLYGSIGAGYYFAFANNADIVDIVVNYLYSKKEQYKNGSYFWRRKESYFNKEVIDLGLAHGNIGILMFLKSAYKIGTEKEKIELMISGIHKFYLEVKQDSNYVQSYWKYFIFIDELNEGIIKQDTSRLGWCYGDLSTLYHLITSASDVGDVNYFNIFSEMALNTILKRATFESSLLDSQWLCHGTGGHAFILEMLLDIFPKSLDIRNLWLKHTFEMFNNNFALNKRNIGLVDSLSGIIYLYMQCLQNDRLDIKGKNILQNVFFL